MKVQRSVVLDSLSSGSGLVFTQAAAFVVSDNMNGFFLLDTSTLRYKFVGFDSAKSHIQSKDIKEDFENLSSFRVGAANYMIAFGSGSISKTREMILLIPVDNPAQFKIYKADLLYKAIKTTLNINTGQLNLEACFSTIDSLYLLNRGTNQSVSISNIDLNKAIRSGFSIIPQITEQSFKLPVLEGFNAAFSGACPYKNDLFVFSATVEKTKNWVDDGEVAGSYIGIAKTDGTILQVSPLRDNKDDLIKEKIESVELVMRPNGAATLYAISDNDNGKSTWFVIEIIGL